MSKEEIKKTKFKSKKKKKKLLLQEKHMCFQ